MTIQIEINNVMCLNKSTHLLLQLLSMNLSYLSPSLSQTFSTVSLRGRRRWDGDFCLICTKTFVKLPTKPEVRSSTARLSKKKVRPARHSTYQLGPFTVTTCTNRSTWAAYQPNHCSEQAISATQIVWATRRPHHLSGPDWLGRTEAAVSVPT